MICTQCGQECAPGTAFCSQCGAPIAGRGQPAVPHIVPAVSGLAIVSIVLGVLGFCTVITGIVGIVLGVVALRQINASNGHLTGQPAAIAGIVVSAASMVTIPILAAIMFPVFAQARDRARATACMSNAKQLSLGLLAYAQDYDGQLPSAGAWSDATNPYIRSTEAFVCPAARELECGYALNAATGGIRIAEVEGPAWVPLLFDSTRGRNGSGGPEAVAARHLRDRASIAFLDGHVRLTESTALTVGHTWDVRSALP